jgi:hypothetical protein
MQSHQFINSYTSRKIESAKRLELNQDALIFSRSFINVVDEILYKVPQQKMEKFDSPIRKGETNADLEQAPKAKSRKRSTSVLKKLEDGEIKQTNRRVAKAESK